MAKNIDIKEIASLVATASGEFSCASQSFSDISALFEAVAALAHDRGLVERLASFGARTCDASAVVYEEASAAYPAYDDVFAEQSNLDQPQEAKHG